MELWRHTHIDDRCGQGFGSVFRKAALSLHKQLQIFKRVALSLSPGPEIVIAQGAAILEDYKNLQGRELWSIAKNREKQSC